MAHGEPRPFGRLHRQLRSPYWWLRWRCDGVEHDVSTKTTSLREAERFRARTAEQFGAGSFVGPAVQRTTFEDLCQLIRGDYAANGRRSADRLEDAITRLSATFKGVRVRSITRSRLDAYQIARLAAGAAASTVRNELNALKRAFRLALEAELVARVPTFPAITLNNTRTGFLEPEDLVALLRELPPAIRSVVEFLSLTGWRRGEALGLTWRGVDFAAGTLRLEPEETKTARARAFPYAVLPPLKALIDRQRAYTKGVERRRGALVPWVFHREGEPIREFHKSWDAACQRAAHKGEGALRRLVRPGLVGRLVHDLRRTAARNLIRAGVAQHVVMQLCGWKTDAMFRRYAIVDGRDLEAGVARLAAAIGGGAGGYSGGYSTRRREGAR